MTRKIFFGFVLFRAFCLMAQDYEQNANLAELGIGPQDDWAVFEQGETHSVSAIPFQNIKAGDTLYSEIMRTFPYMSASAAAEDINSGTDSLALRVELWQSHFYDITKFTFVKELKWDLDKTHLSQSLINAAGSWDADVNDSRFRNQRYFILVIIAEAGHRKYADGCNLSLWMRGTAIK